ncbi:hypothetical protein DIU31_031945 [Mucilaginibacter rubeus]|uniref:Uncharacterized protein n=1 Tax=Mucilaginibacter rubeus TaxID=2027860 RepID=A0AAE6MLV7_9SPHI|nr:MULTISPECIES: hypothetical protein [Mucilaginibacter]QEM07894.1 hypothetical protein DIU31_031945 [Mucilaginibacter rubeus]QEM20346.1 hypothetical protein DIU38_031550 [Mucilaginibacter gossypii]QTE42934.1 hypothetical protein J3L19_29105 [Mucilaginibacter rubeus]QTE49535.1 hypothetical protein J3L21_29065 [Mucilaginibacter rubeus]QTE54631.1 hypothetical protein J3L23_20690 [Mucilaginibacter rubeus]
MNIAYENIMRVADIPASELPEDFISFLSGLNPAYRDQVLEEHLYCPDTLFEEEPEGAPYPKDFADMLSRLRQLLFDLDCAYFRLVNP